jgi:hypothetical protein
VDCAQVSYEQLRSAFSGPENEVRVELDWGKLEQLMSIGQASVDFAMRRHWNLSKLHAPWYKNQSGEPTSYDNAGAVAWSFEELTDPNRPKTQVFDQDHIHDKDRSERDVTWLYTARILTLDIHEDDQLVLDGNHRLMMILGDFARSHIAVQHYQIHAAFDAVLVPDIDYWDR